MSLSHLVSVTLSGLCLAGCSSSPATSVVEVYSFEADAVGALPQGFVAAETSGQGLSASWQVADGLDPDDPGHVVSVETKNSGQTYNMLLSEAGKAADFDMSVYIFARSGEEDRGGGLVWRARDAENYYVARWNPLEDNLRLYTVIEGRRSMLESADVTVRPGMWHRLKVSMRGNRITVDFDGERLLESKDASFEGAGLIGLWTKADASTLFDSVEWRATP